MKLLIGLCRSSKTAYKINETSCLGAHLITEYDIHRKGSHLNIIHIYGTHIKIHRCTDICTAYI